MKKKKTALFLGGVLGCLLLSGCSAVMDLAKYDFSSWQEGVGTLGKSGSMSVREHVCKIVVRDGEGDVLYESGLEQPVRHGAELVGKLEEEEITLMAEPEEKVIYTYEFWDNDKRVSFSLYEPGNLLSCGVGSLQVYFTLSGELKEEFLHPEEWMTQQKEKF